MEKFQFDKYDFKRSLLFSWPTWTGKTYNAEKILAKYKSNKSEKSAIDTYLITDAHFKQLVKSNNLMLRKPDEWATSLTYFPLEMMVRCEVLLYDDIGVSDTTDAYLRDLTYILDKRIDRWTINIFTTNLSRQELKDKLNERITSRLLFNADVVVFRWKDRRLDTTNYFEA